METTKRTTITKAELAKVPRDYRGAVVGGTVHVLRLDPKEGTVLEMLRVVD